MSQRHIFLRQLGSLAVSTERRATISPRCYTSKATPIEDLIPDSPGSNHNDLASFLEYATRSGLNPKSTVYVGTHYEYTVGASLARHGFSVRRIGGASDYGIDLLGTWNFPTPSSSFPSGTTTLKVLVQCKAGPIGPHTIRELEGAFVGAPAGWRGGEGVLGVLASRKVATKGVGEALGRSRWPMMFVCCDAEGRISQVRWNQRAELEGLEGMNAAVRRSAAGEIPEVILTWKGQILSRS